MVKALHVTTSIRRLVTIVFAIASLPSSPSVQAQPYALRFQRYTIDEGLSQNNVTSIIQDQYGFMWFGTLDGLNRFDGYDFVTFKHRPDNPQSLSASTISALALDKEGNLWVGTMSAGLNRIHLASRRLTRYQHDEANLRSLSDNRVRCLLVDRHGRLWVGTRDGGLSRFDAQTGVFQRFIHDPSQPESLSDNHIRTLMEDSQGRLWVGTARGGLNVLVSDQGKGRFIHFQRFSHVEALAEDRHGFIWIGTYGSGLARIPQAAIGSWLAAASTQDGTGTYNPAMDVFRHDPDVPTSLGGNFVEAILEDHQGELWVATMDGGLNRFDYENRDFIRYLNDAADPHSISYNNIDVLYEDRSGMMWIGTWGGGVNKVDRKPMKFLHLKRIPGNSNSLCHNYVRAIAQDPLGHIWVGTSGGGLDRLKGEKRVEVLHIRKDEASPGSLSSNDVRAIYFDHRGTMWVGTYGGGLNQMVEPDQANLTQETARFIQYVHDPNNPKSISNDFVWCILEDGDGYLWIGTNGGLNRFDPRTREFTHFKHDPRDSISMSQDIVRTLFLDSRGNLWAGTYHGLNRLDRKTGRVTRYLHNPEDSTSLNHDSIISIFEDHEGILWIGTLGGGLNRLDPRTGRAIAYGEKDGLPSTFVHAIAEAPNHDLWFSTNRGLVRMDRSDPDKPRFRVYDVRDGLQSNEFNAGAVCTGASGEMIFGGIHGLNRFYPDRVRDNPFPPSVVLTGFRIFNQPVDFDSSLQSVKTIKLDYKSNFFTLEFASLDFTNPDKNQYMYKLEGIDPNWIHSATRRFASYTYLPPGEYTFYVKGSNNDGVWSETAASVRIVIEPPFWQTLWFRLIMGGSLAGWLFFLVYFRIRKLQKEKATQEQFSRELIATQERERQRLAAELHDGLGQNLIILNNLLVERLQNGGPASKLRKDLEGMSKLVLESIEQAREIAYGLHPHHLERLGLTRTLEAMLKNLQKYSKISLDWELDDLRGLLPAETEIHIYRIVQELLNNIIKHAEAAHARVTVERQKSLVLILVQDDGKGLPDNFRQKGFGWTTISERLRIIQGRVKVQCRPNEGTQVRIEIPLNS